MRLTLLPETIVEERDGWTIAVNRNQDLLGKTMLVLRRDCTAVTDIEPAEWADLHVEIARVTAALRTLFAPDQLNYAFLMNLDAQVHLHVVPRYTSSRTWRDQQFEDPHWGSAFGHEQRVLDGASLAALASQLRDALPA